MCKLHTVTHRPRAQHVSLQAFPYPSAFFPMNPEGHLPINFSPEPRQASSHELLSISLNMNNPYLESLPFSVTDCGTVRFP
jgi:hypothetical protein